MNNSNEKQREVEKKYKNLREKMKEILSKDVTLESKIEAAAEIDKIKKNLSFILNCHEEQVEKNLILIQRAEEKLSQIEKGMW